MNTCILEADHLSIVTIEVEIVLQSYPQISNLMGVVYQFNSMFTLLKNEQNLIMIIPVWEFWGYLVVLREDFVQLAIFLKTVFVTCSSKIGPFRVKILVQFAVMAEKVKNHQISCFQSIWKFKILAFLIDICGMSQRNNILMCTWIYKNRDNKPKYLYTITRPVAYIFSWNNVVFFLRLSTFST